MDATVRHAENNPPPVAETGDLHAIIIELREELETSRRDRGSTDQVRARYEQEAGP